jgi:hypothetical protein
MSDEHNDYLWDRTGAVDAEVAELEEVLQPLRFDHGMPAVDPPKLERRPNPLWWLAVAAGVGLVIWGWIARQQSQLTAPVARTGIPSVAVAPTSAATSPVEPAGPSWRVTAVSGAPVCDGKPVEKNGALHVGQWVETDASSRAQIEVADIGTVDLKPSSRLRLVGTADHEHRIQLQRGMLSASVDAPPRVFLVETPKATAVDLGCVYELEVADDKTTWLRVKLGWVSLEANEVVSVVPAGAMCRAAADGTPGLPVRRAAAARYVDAAAQFVTGGSDAKSGALDVLVDEAGSGDAVTLWHLLARVSAPHRRAVYDRLASLVSAPLDEAAVLRLEQDALESWGQALGVLPPPGWPDEGPPDPPAPVWQPGEQWQPEEKQWQPKEKQWSPPGRSSVKKRKSTTPE